MLQLQLRLGVILQTASHRNYYDQFCAERRQAMWVDTFRLVGVARQFRSVRPPDAGLLIRHLAFGAGWTARLLRPRVRNVFLIRLGGHTGRSVAAIA